MKTRNYLFLGIGVVAAGSLALAARPIYDAINSNVKHVYSINQTKDGDFAVGTESLTVGDLHVTNLQSSEWGTNFTTLFGVGQGQEYAPEPAEQEILPPAEDIPPEEYEEPEKEEEKTPEVEEEEIEEAEESNTVVKKNDKTAATILGIVAAVVTCGLAAVIVTVFYKNWKKQKAENK